MEFIGEMAALSTAFFWAFTTLFFAAAGRMIGSFKVNKIRLVLAALIYTIVLLISKGHIFPDNLTLNHILWLGASGIIGFVIGDGAGFKAMVIIGPRLAVLVYSSAPVIATLMAWIMLGEKLHLLDLLGIFLTVGGIAWVVSERAYENRPKIENHPDTGSKAYAVFLAFIWGFGQAAGLVLSKQGMLYTGTPIEPMEASYIRILVAMVVIWTISALRGNLLETIKATRNFKAVGMMLGGAVCGPFLGVWMSLVGVKYIAAGIAATLNSTTPIWMLPLVRIVHKEHLNSRIILGTIITVGGIALLMLQ